MSNQIIAEASIDVNEAPRQAENAQKTADKANNLAKTTDGNIKNINDPNYLSPFEKPQLQIQMDNFATIYAADKDIAKAESIDFTAYDAAYQAYLAYMTPLVADMTTYSPIVRATFNRMVTAVQLEQKRFSAATQAKYNQQMSQARTDINDGQTKYKALQSEAETMKSSVAGISDAADRAISSAGFASNAASTASQAANEASQAASSALASAINAQDDANSAVAKAELTASNFGPVKQTADSALASAINAQTDASSAVAQASSAAADSKNAKQIAGAVSQSYKTLTDGSTMTIAELEGGLAVKLTKKDLDGYATETWAQNQIKTTADGINGTLSSVKSTVDSHTTSINDLKADSHGFKNQFTTVTKALGKQTTDIGTLQASSKELISNFDSLSTANGKNEHNISQLKLDAKEFSSTLETVKTQVQNSAVGTNLVTDSEQEFAGKAYGFHDYNLASLPELTPGKTYTMSFSAKVDDKAVNCKQNVFVCVYNPSWGWSSTWVWASVPISTDYHRVTGTFTVPEGITDANCISVYLSHPVINGNSDPSSDNSDAAGTGYIKEFKLEKGSVATDWCPNPADTATVTALTKVKQTADSVQVLANDNKGDLAKLQVTAKGLQSTVKDKVSSSQLTQLSGQLTNEIKDLSSSTSSKFTQTFNDINDMVKKGDVVNQFNLDAGGELLSTTGNSTKIVFSSPNIIFDSKNPVQIPNANIPGTLTGKTFEAGTITATTKIIGTDIEAPLIHSPSGSFELHGNTGDIIGASIHSADNSWGISKDGVINGSTINGSTINAPNLNLGDNGQLTGSYGVNDSIHYFQPINGTGSLNISHGYIQSTANIIYYNKILNGIGGDAWGHWASSTQFIPAPDKVHPDTGNVAESTLTPAFLKLDIFNADKSSVVSRAYIDGTGLYINDGGTESVVSMLSDYELLSNGMAYLNAGIKMPKSASFTFGNLAMNGYHTIAMLDGKALYFQDKTGKGGNPIELVAKTFTKRSQLSIKHDITPLSTAESSRLLNAIDVEKFRYTHDGATYKYQYGGVIDDVNSLGSKQYSMPSELLSEDGTGINLDSLTGILIKTVQEQERKIGKLSMRLTRLEMEK